ncbi:hypothetical protein LCGC14_2287090 [marine sediment metagenome]|uniref:Uncharacterized protein n=1 Tax=marine sediment metagenome TaxID=412755 RepID=A0A0F9CS71_9ZZZZ
MSENALRNLNCVFNQLGNDSKKIFFVYGLFSLHTGSTAFNWNRYSMTELKQDVKENISLKFPNLENFNDYWDRMKDLFDKCSFNLKTDIWYSFQEKIYKRFMKEITHFILQKIDSLPVNEKIIIKEFLINPPEHDFFLSEWGGFSRTEGEAYEWRKGFEEKLNSFNIETSNYRYLLVSVGILYKSKWMTTNKGTINNGIMYDFPNYFHLLKSKIIKSLQIRSDLTSSKPKKPSRGDFIEF